MILETIQQRVREGHYLIKSHAAVHALKEGFERRHMVEAVLRGTVIEDYAEVKRALMWRDNVISGPSNLLARCM